MLMTIEKKGILALFIPFSTLVLGLVLTVQSGYGCSSAVVLSL
jgi:hypothetical protein